MDWFNTSGISSFAKSAVSKAQKSIDKVLDIKEDEDDGPGQEPRRPSRPGTDGTYRQRVKEESRPVKDLNKKPKVFADNENVRDKTRGKPHANERNSARNIKLEESSKGDEFFEAFLESSPSKSNNTETILRSKTNHRKDNLTGKSAELAVGAAKDVNLKPKEPSHNISKNKNISIHSPRISEKVNTTIVKKAGDEAKENILQVSGKEDSSVLISSSPDIIQHDKEDVDCTPQDGDKNSVRIAHGTEYDNKGSVKRILETEKSDKVSGKSCLRPEKGEKSLVKISLGAENDNDKSMKSLPATEKSDDAPAKNFLETRESDDISVKSNLGPENDNQRSFKSSLVTKSDDDSAVKSFLEAVKDDGNHFKGTLNTKGSETQMREEGLELHNKDISSDHPRTNIQTKSTPYPMTVADSANVSETDRDDAGDSESLSQRVEPVSSSKDKGEDGEVSLHNECESLEHKEESNDIGEDALPSLQCIPDNLDNSSKGKVSNSEEYRDEASTKDHFDMKGNPAENEILAGDFMIDSKTKEESNEELASDVRETSGTVDSDDCCEKTVQLLQYEPANDEVPSSCISSDSNNQHNVPSIPEESREAEKGITDTVEVKSYQEEISRLKELVEARETKMIYLSKENIELQEALSLLRSEMNQVEGNSASDAYHGSEEREQHIQEIQDIKKQLQIVIKERDDLEEQFIDMETKLTKSSDQLVADYTAALSEKERSISDLLIEGESLSKREFKSTNALKKLREKFKALETKYEQSRKENERKDAELLRLESSLKEKVDQEKTMRDELQKLEMITDQQEEEISALKDQLEDAEDKMKGLQTTLDCGYQEINRLNLEKSNMASEVKEYASAKQAREEADQKVSEIERQAKYDREQSRLEIDDLRLTIKRTEQESTRREETLKMEISDLQQRIEDAEGRNQELSQSIGEVSRPLLRQIENLQSSHHNQALNWERIEKQLNERLASSQQQLALSADKERSAVDYAMEMKVRVTSLEARISEFIAEKQKSAETIAEKNEKLKLIEDNMKLVEKKLHTSEESYRNKLAEFQNEKESLENQLIAERLKFELEISTAMAKQNELQLSRRPSGEVFGEINGEKIQNDIASTEGYSKSRSRTSSSDSSAHVIDTQSNFSTTAVMEQLHVKLRQKDGELQLLKQESISLQRTRESLAHELVKLSNTVEELNEKCADHEELLQKNKELDSRYNAVLQMYGEKAEEVDELKMDLHDIKQMYKQQIQQLLER